jgi:hypothetical protein
MDGFCKDNYVYLFFYMRSGALRHFWAGISIYIYDNRALTLQLITLNQLFEINSTRILLAIDLVVVACPVLFER